MKICIGRKTRAAQLRATLKTLAKERESRHGVHKKASKMANRSKKIVSFSDEDGWEPQSASDSEWSGSESSESEHDSDFEDEEPIEIVNSGSSSTTTLLQKRKRDVESESESEEESESELDECEIEYLDETETDHAAVDTSNITTGKRVRKKPKKVEPEPAKAERTDKWYEVKEFADDIAKLNRQFYANKKYQTSERIKRYQTILKDSVSTTIAINMAKSTGWLAAVQAMPTTKKRLKRWRKNCLEYHNKEWIKEATRRHEKLIKSINKSTKV